LNDIVHNEPPVPPVGQFSDDFYSFSISCLQKEEENLPTCAELLLRPWITKFVDSNSALKDWIIANGKRGIIM